jgi:hypothetical protein
MHKESIISSLIKKGKIFRNWQIICSNTSQVRINMRGKCGNRKYSHILTKSRMILNTIVLNSLSLLKLRSSLCRMLLHKRLHKNLRKSRMLLLLFILLDSLIVLVHYKVLIISISSIMKINIKHVPLIS